MLSTVLAALMYGIIVLIFRIWFGNLPLTSGDWGVQYIGSSALMSWFPQAWHIHFNGGLGGNDVFLLGLNTYHFFVTEALSRTGFLSWELIERIMWFWPFLLISGLSSFLLSRHLLGKTYAVIATFVYVVNSYILMIVGGGQTGVALGYACSPLVLWAYIKSIEQEKLRRHFFWSVITGVVFSFQLLFDLRMAYITLIAIGVLWIVMRRSVLSVVVPAIVSVLFHLFWLYPFVLQRENPLSGLGDAFVNPGMVKFLSFATFEQTFSFLHPNWPENVFGKINFLQPEFLGIPLIAFSALLFISRSSISQQLRKVILSFSFIGIMGIFLAKGANAPFGEIYLWLFTHIPGFIMFRDPTKFYLLISLSYVVLIPFVIEYLRRKKIWRRFNFIVIVLFFLYWSLVHRDAIFGRLSGTFSPHTTPSEYISLKEHLSKQPSFSRVLWIPARQRYGYFSDDMPGITLDTLKLTSTLDERREQLARYGVSYIVVPTDPLGELFVSDRKYDDQKRGVVISVLNTYNDLTQLSGFGDIAVYKTSVYYNHVFFSDTPRVPVETKRISPTEYLMVLPNGAGGKEIIFSESFDPNWELTIGSTHVAPARTADGIQKYRLPNAISGPARLYYRVQTAVRFGSVISSLFALCVVCYLLYESYELYRKRNI